MTRAPYECAQCASFNELYAGLHERIVDSNRLIARCNDATQESERLRRQLQDSQKLVESLHGDCEKYSQEACSALTQLDPLRKRCNRLQTELNLVSQQRDELLVSVSSTQATLKQYEALVEKQKQQEAPEQAPKPSEGKNRAVFWKNKLEKRKAEVKLLKRTLQEARLETRHIRTRCKNALERVEALGKRLKERGVLGRREDQLVKRIVSYLGEDAEAASSSSEDGSDAERDARHLEELLTADAYEEAEISDVEQILTMMRLPALLSPLPPDPQPEFVEEPELPFPDVTESELQAAQRQPDPLALLPESPVPSEPALFAKKPEQLEHPKSSPSTLEPQSSEQSEPDSRTARPASISQAAPNVTRPVLQSLPKPDSLSTLPELVAVPEQVPVESHQKLSKSLESVTHPMQPELRARPRPSLLEVHTEFISLPEPVLVEAPSELGPPDSQKPILCAEQSHSPVPPKSATLDMQTGFGASPKRVLMEAQSVESTQLGLPMPILCAEQSHSVVPPKSVSLETQTELGASPEPVPTETQREKGTQLGLTEPLHSLMVPSKPVPLEMQVELGASPEPDLMETPPEAVTQPGLPEPLHSLVPPKQMPLEMQAESGTSLEPDLMERQPASPRDAELPEPLHPLVPSKPMPLEAQAESGTLLEPDPMEIQAEAPRQLELLEPLEPIVHAEQLNAPVPPNPEPLEMQTEAGASPEPVLMDTQTEAPLQPELLGSLESVPCAEQSEPPVPPRPEPHEMGSGLGALPEPVLTDTPPEAPSQQGLLGSLESVQCAEQSGSLVPPRQGPLEIRTEWGDSLIEGQSETLTQTGLVDSPKLVSSSREEDLVVPLEPVLPQMQMRSEASSEPAFVATKTEAPAQSLTAPFVTQQGLPEVLEPSIVTTRMMSPAPPALLTPPESSLCAVKAELCEASPATQPDIKTAIPDLPAPSDTTLCAVKVEPCKSPSASPNAIQPEFSLETPQPTSPAVQPKLLAVPKVGSALPSPVLWDPALRSTQAQILVPDKELRTSDTSSCELRLKLPASPQRTLVSPASVPQPQVQLSEPFRVLSPQLSSPLVLPEPSEESLILPELSDSSWESSSPEPSPKKSRGPLRGSSRKELQSLPQSPSKTPQVSLPEPPLEQSSPPPKKDPRQCLWGSPQKEPQSPPQLPPTTPQVSLPEPVPEQSSPSPKEVPRWCLRGSSQKEVQSLPEPLPKQLQVSRPEPPPEQSRPSRKNHPRRCLRGSPQKEPRSPPQSLPKQRQVSLPEPPPEQQGPSPRPPKGQLEQSQEPPPDALGTAAAGVAGPSRQLTNTQIVKGPEDIELMLCVRIPKGQLDHLRKCMIYLDVAEDNVNVSCEGAAVPTVSVHTAAPSTTRACGPVEERLDRPAPESAEERAEGHVTGPVRVSASRPVQGKEEWQSSEQHQDGGDPGAGKMGHELGGIGRPFVAQGDSLQAARGTACRQREERKGEMHKEEILAVEEPVPAVRVSPRRKQRIARERKGEVQLVEPLPVTRVSLRRKQQIARESKGDGDRAPGGGQPKEPPQVLAPLCKLGPVEPPPPKRRWLARERPSTKVHLPSGEPGKPKQHLPPVQIRPWRGTLLGACQQLPTKPQLVRQRPTTGEQPLLQQQALPAEASPVAEPLPEREQSAGGSTPSAHQLPEKELSQDPPALPPIAGQSLGIRQKRPQAQVGHVLGHR